MDYAIEKCREGSNTRCTAPFVVTKSTCYNLEWKTEGALTHTTAEVRDAGSGEIVYYRDTNGEWTPQKGELVYMDFKPKIPGTGNNTVEYKVTTCEPLSARRYSATNISSNVHHSANESENQYDDSPVSPKTRAISSELLLLHPTV
ncbi:hypothetical protein F5Y07DRAFT_404001 [Xylaria sp. FL0933]|nr:hypothetical protein F5Y07DRAFT_404001 [Xylaria sp. FL0933]